MWRRRFRRDPPYVHQEIVSRTFSPEAQAVLDELNSLLEYTFPYRRKDWEKNPERNAQAWDQGFWGLYLIAKENKLPEIDSFRAAFNTLQEKIAKQAREWNFI